jgi:hypothetical protein
MLELKAREANGGKVEELSSGTYRLSMPAGGGRGYCWAQLDDHLELERQNFPWQPPFQLTLSARVSGGRIPGTWGFGFWNDPFSASWGVSGAARRFPALPQAVWFFHASPPNYLALRDDHPASGWLAATFSALPIHPLLFALAVPALPLLALRPFARLARRAGTVFVRDDAARLDVDVTQWHNYRLECTRKQAQFFVNDSLHFETGAVPLGRLGFTVWIDNQYAAFRPDGAIRFGTLPSPEPAWLEIAGLEIEVL